MQRHPDLGLLTARSRRDRLHELAARDRLLLEARAGARQRPALLCRLAAALALHNGGSAGPLEGRRPARGA
jgi:hypothetical protein